LLQGERQKFLADDWPRIHATIQRLGLKPEELLNGATGSLDAAPSKTVESSPPESNPKKEER
jgi:hypothetical protein